MEDGQIPRFQVSDFIALLNQTLEYSYSSVEIEGEISSFKVNQNKWVFFDIKDEQGALNCFMTLFQLRVPLQDGLRVVIKAAPKVTAWGKFSLTVQSVKLSGEGNIKKGFELLKEKLSKEGLFDDDRKRHLPEMPNHIGVISSVQSAGYADFIKILNDRWGGLRVGVAHVQVQGDTAPDQIIKAIKYFNEQKELPEVLVIVRGGGSADDLATFNDELLVRAVASSRIPTLVGIGHETDVVLAELVADRRASTPSNAAQIIVPDKKELILATRQLMVRVLMRLESKMESIWFEVRASKVRCLDITDSKIDIALSQLLNINQIIVAYNPRTILTRGYAIVRGIIKKGSIITIEQSQQNITAEVKDVRRK